MADYKFYVKASPDGKSLGDCPFTHRANLALKLKKVSSVYILIDLKHKPKWFSDVNPAGSVPALDIGTQVMGDSYGIVKFLDQTYPDPPLDLPGNKEAEEVTGKAFTFFSEWVKNADASKDAELEKRLTAELQKIDSFLGKSPGTYLCGDSMAIADCVFLPRLYCIVTVAKHFKKYTKFEAMSSLVKYMDTAFATAAWKATDYPPEFIYSTWEKYFQ